MLGVLKNNNKMIIEWNKQEELKLRKNEVSLTIKNLDFSNIFANLNEVYYFFSYNIKKN